jgi:hypothetical protein
VASLRNAKTRVTVGVAMPLTTMPATRSSSAALAA